MNYMAFYGVFGNMQGHCNLFVGGSPGDPLKDLDLPLRQGRRAALAVSSVPL